MSGDIVRLDGQLAIPGVVTSTALNLPDELGFDEWLKHGKAIARVHEASLWWLGDWWRYGERYGPRVDAIEWLPWSHQTCRNAGWIAERIGVSRRRDTLAWSHHAEVAALEPAEQDEWLDRAEQGDDDGLPWSREQLRSALRNQRSLNPPPLPAGRYRCIVIDPPWPIAKIVRQIHLEQGPALDYPTMPLDEIAALPIPNLAAEDGCHVYLWTTHRLLPAALDLFDGWGVAYECQLTWIKPSGMTPFSWMYDTEHVLFGRLGSLPLERQGLRLSLAAATAGHSVKPGLFYERVREASPGPRLDMFARQQRDGFIPWGDEVAA